LTRFAGQLQLAGTDREPVDAPILLRGVSHVAAEAQPGDLFIARAGAKTHGAQFCREALDRGAVAILTDPAGRDRAAAAGTPVLVADDPAALMGPVAALVYGDPSAAMTMIGVTGTNGKTTTAYLLEAGLAAAGRATGLLGTVVTRIGGQAVPSVRTTPEAPELQATLAVMRERGVDAVAMEVSSHALALRRVDGVRFAAGLFTNLSQDHLDFSVTMEDYFAAKARLFDGRSRHEVVNSDDEWGRKLVRESTITVSPSGDRDARWAAVGVRVGERGCSFTAIGPDGLQIPVGLGLRGKYNAENALIALAALHACGVDPRAAAAGFASAQVPGRLEPVEAGQPFTALVDYAHNPGAVAAMLGSLRESAAGRVIVVLGCGGERDRAKRPLMGRAAAAGADVVIITDDNPRGEDPATIRSETAAGAADVPDADVSVVPGRRDAIAEAVRRALPGDTVVVAGKGHEQGQEIAGVVHPFDDRTVLREEISNAGAVSS
jgi:UDP-N-acetylmuramoyl-L-alanyl-D-glutamate--2,6-diaminopimelate ligase